MEMALVLPILLLLVFGITSFGQVFNAQLSMTHAAREGVRHYAITGLEGEAVTKADNAATGQVITNANVTWSGAGYPCFPATKGDASIGQAVTMKITYDTSGLDLFIPLWGPLQPTLTGTGTMRCGG